MKYILKSCLLHGEFLAKRLIYFPKFDELLHQFLYGQTFGKKNSKQKDSKISKFDENLLFVKSDLVNEWYAAIFFHDVSPCLQ